MSMRDETELIQNSALGDVDAYKMLLNKHLPYITNYVARMTKNSIDGEDIVQETFLRLWTHGSKFEPEKAMLSTWLHQIAHNLCIDYFRKNKRTSLEESKEEVSHYNSPLKELEKIDKSKQVSEVLMQLSTRERSAVILCYYQEVSNKEAALILEMSVSALESLLARGRNKLRGLLVRN